jgi:hypothetical protein
MATTTRSSFSATRPTLRAHRRRDRRRPALRRVASDPALAPIASAADASAVALRAKAPSPRAVEHAAGVVGFEPDERADGCTARARVVNSGQLEIDSSCTQNMHAYAAVPYGSDIVIAGSTDAFIPGSTNREQLPLLMRLNASGAVVWFRMPRIEQTSNNYRLQGLTISPMAR